MATYRKILCPTDFSEASYEALRQAVELARESGAEVGVVYVEAPPATVTPLAGLAPNSESQAHRRAEAVKNLCAVLEDYVPPQVRAKPMLKEGTPAEEIVRAADEEQADLIVLATHGAAGWQPGVLGVVAEQVLRTAHCPVLSVSGPAIQRRINRWAGANGHAADAHLRPSLATASSNALYLDGD